MGAGWLDFRQCGALMHRHVVGRIARDLVLRVLGTAVVSVTFAFHVLRMDVRDRALHMASLGVPAHMIAEREFTCHRYAFRHQNVAEYFRANRCAISPPIRIRTLFG